MDNRALEAFEYEAEAVSTRRDDRQLASGQKMKATLIGMRSETPLHVGTGQVSGIVDLSVARDHTTGLPVIPGSSLKGAMRCDAKTRLDKSTIKAVFGEQETGAAGARAGSVAFADAMLLLLPVRSPAEGYRLVTSPSVLRHAARLAEMVDAELALAGFGPLIANAEGQLAQAIGHRPPALTPTKQPSALSLEERNFEGIDAAADAASLIDALADCFSSRWIGGDVRVDLERRLTIVRDGDLSWFGRNALVIAARNRLDCATKSSVTVWYEEAVATNALFLGAVFPRTCMVGAEIETARNVWFAKAFAAPAYTRVGANVTAGHGWLALQALGGSGG